MRKTFIIAAKELRHMGHDRFTLFLTLMVPLLQLLLYGYALEIRFRDLPAALVNHDVHPAGRALAARIAESPLFAIEPSLRTEAEVRAALRRGSIRMAIEIPADFSSRMLLRKDTALRVWVDGSDIATSNYLLAALDALGQQATIERLPEAPQVHIEPTILFNSGGGSAAFLLPGLVAILIQMITTLLLALSIAGERERGTLERLLVTQMTAGPIVLGKVLAVGAVSLAEAVILVLSLRWLFQIPIAGSAVLLVAVLPLLALAPIGIGLLVASHARNQLHAFQLTQLIFLPSILISGFLMPREFLNVPLVWISDLIPTTYLVSIVRGIILRGASLSDLAPSLLNVAGFSLVLTALGYWAVRRSLAE